MNPKVENDNKDLKYFVSDIIKAIAGIFIIFIFYKIISSFISGIKEEAFYLELRSILDFSFVLLLCFMPYSVIHFLFLKNKDNMHKIIFYKFSVPLSIVLFIFIWNFLPAIRVELLLLFFIPFSVVYFLLNKAGKIRHTVFYGVPVPLCILLFVLLLTFMSLVNTSLLSMLGIIGIFGGGITLLIQPFLTIYLFCKKEKMTRDVIFLYILPVNITTFIMIFYRLSGIQNENPMID